MTNTTHPLTAARVEKIAHIGRDEVITLNGTEYYVSEAYGGALELVRLSDLAEGFKADVSRHRITASRKATEEERGRVYAMKVAKIEAEAQFRPGALVRTIKANKHVDPNALYVILKANAKTVSITEIGGNSSGAHLTAGRAGLAIVDPADVLK
jgi:hypothetical protein